MSISVLIHLAQNLASIVVIQSIQIMISGIFLGLAYKILKRNRNRLTWTLSGFYFFTSAGFVLVFFRIIININPYTFIIYFISLFLLFFGQTFLVLFNINLFKIESQFKMSKFIMIILIYAILILCILSVPNGFEINEDTNWKPVWSWTFLLILYAFNGIAVILPFIIIHIKLYKIFEDKELKKKLRNFLIGFFGITIGWYGAMLYNTWDNPIFKSIWGVISLVIAIFSGWIIYKSYGKGL